LAARGGEAGGEAVRRGLLARLAGRAAPWAGMAAFGLLWLRARRAPPRRVLVPPEALPAFYEATEPGRGRRAEAPPQIPPPGWKDVLWRTWLEVGRDRLLATAGGITFYALFAIFPAIGAFVSLYGLFADVGQVSRQLDQLAAFVPAGALTLVADQMIRLATARPETLSAAFLINLLVSVWSANLGMAALFDGLNVVYEEREKRNFFVRRAMTYGFTLAAVVFLTLTTAILVAVPIALSWLGLGDSLLVPLRWLVLLAVATTAFAVIYRYGPSREHARWRWIWPGAAAAAVVWVASSLAFSWYVNNVANFDVTYGPLGAVMGFMAWIWISAMVLLLGGELNAELEHQTAEDSTTGRPLPIGRRGARMADTVGEAAGGPLTEARVLWAMLRRQAARLRPARPPARPGAPPGPPRSAAR
jgi:membrane protein